METTNFSILKSSRTRDREVVSLSLTPFNCCLNTITIMTELCPSNLLAQRLISHKISSEKFTEIYKSKILSNVDAQEVYDKLKDKIVCDWMGMSDVSPRSILVDWLVSELGVEILEIPRHPPGGLSR